MGGIYVHGGRYTDNHFEMNGVTINDYQSSGASSGGIAVPNPDTIQTFKVQTGQYDASFGRNAGANVNLITKGGSNEFHGTLLHFFRNEALNANDFFFNRDKRPKPILRQNQFGGTLGGPLKKEKLLFFTSYQGTRQANGLAVGCRGSAFAPPLTNDRSAAAIGAMFAGRRGQLQGTAGPAILPDGSNINPVALKLLQVKLPDGSFLLPTPQVIDPSQPFDRRGFSSYSDACTFDENQFMINLDYLHTAKSRFSGRFFSADSDLVITIPRASVPGFPRTTGNDFRNFSLAHNYVFSPRLYNEWRLGFHRTRATSKQAAPFTFSNVGISAATQVDDLPVITITGSYDLGGSFPIDLAQNTYSIQDSLLYVRGRHTLKFGGGVTRTQDNFPEFRFNGTLIFLSWPDFLLGLNGASNGTGLFSNVFASVDFLGLPERALRIWDGFGYVQDDFKVSSQFTLNLGLRYERIGQAADKLGRNSNINPALLNPNPPAAGTLEGITVPANFSGGAIPRGVTQLDNDFGVDGDGQNNLAPRIGFAWQVLPQSSRLVVRGGYGIYYSRPIGQPFIQLISAPPFAQFRQAIGAPNAAATFADPFPQPLLSPGDYPRFFAYSPATALSQTVIDNDYRPPIVQQYSLNVQTAFGRDFLLEVGYVGNRGTHLPRLRSLNQAGMASTSNPIRGVTTNTVANIPLRARYQGWVRQEFNEVETAGQSWYNGLAVSVTKRLNRGLQFLASYTWSKTLDTDATAAAGAGTTQVSGNQNESRAHYGPSAFNRAHRFVLSYVYQLPGPQSRRSLTGRLLGGWAMAGVAVFQSGQNLSIGGTNSNNVFGITADRAQLAPGCTHADLVTAGSVDSKLSTYYKATCFTVWPVIGADGRGTDFGNSGPGIVRGPDQRNFDLSIIKRTRVTEKSDIEFRVEFFNAFNTPQFANPNSVFGSASFGAISATAVNPRLIQLALKLNF
ncbi:MAG: TonB-dependent receptor [Acidobacteria bacterium]|nr:TonB-dependent receptor [Acidobacteriota bacterium]